MTGRPLRDQVRAALRHSHAEARNYRHDWEPADALAAVVPLLPPEQGALAGYMVARIDETGALNIGWDGMVHFTRALADKEMVQADKFYPGHGWFLVEVRHLPVAEGGAQ